MSTTPQPRALVVDDEHDCADGFAFFSAQAHVLTVLGDNLVNTITVSRDVAAAIPVNSGVVSILREKLTVANTGGQRRAAEQGRCRLLVRWGGQRHPHPRRGRRVLIGGAKQDVRNADPVTTTEGGALADPFWVM
jgi:hypothetical protein